MPAHVTVHVCRASLRNVLPVFDSDRIDPRLGVQCSEANRPCGDRNSRPPWHLFSPAQMRRPHADDL